MLSGWLDRHDPDGERRGADRIARAVITVARSAVPEFEAFCERRGLRLLRSTPAGLQSAVLVVEGEPLPIQGLAHITALVSALSCGSGSGSAAITSALCRCPCSS